MPKTQFKIWGRELALDLVYDCYQGESITASQKEAYNCFCQHLDLLDSCKAKVEEYCKKDHPDIDTENIFRFVMPQAIFIQRADNHVVGIMCAYKFDIEHGLAIVFRNETFDQIGPQDLIL